MSVALSYTSAVDSAVDRPKTRATTVSFATFLAVAAIAATVDLLTKELATGLLSDGRFVAIGDQLGFMLVYNTGSAGGVSIGPFTRSINVLATMLAIGMVIRVVSPLASVDARAALPLGLLTGGALGNLASMLAGPEGVADFLAVRIGHSGMIIMNIADLFLWVGALLLAPVVLRLLGAIRAERRAAKAALTAARA